MEEKEITWTGCDTIVKLLKARYQKWSEVHNMHANTFLEDSLV